FLLPLSINHLYLHSFPTRRSSDLFESKSEAGRSRELSCPYRQEAKNRKPHAIARLTINIWTPQNHKQFPKTIGEEKFCFYISGKDRKSTRLNSSHVAISYAVFCLK